MAFTGMTVTNIRSSAGELTRQADELTAIRSRVESLVNEASRHWEGSDISQFRGTWQNSYRARLNQAADRLRSMSAELVRQAAQQEATSGDSSTGRPPISAPLGGGGVGNVWDKISSSPAYNLGKTGLKLITASLAVNKAIQITRDVLTFSKLANAVAKILPGSTAAAGIARIGETFARFRLTSQLGFAADLGGNVVKWGTQIQSKFGFLGKPLGTAVIKLQPLAKAIGGAARVLGVVGAGIMLADGVHDIFKPDYTGWRGGVDRVMGVAGVVGGGGVLLAATGLVALGPVGWTVVGVAAAAVGVWDLGNLIYDNREVIAQTAQKVGTAIGSAASKAASWVKGLFSR